MCFFIFSHLENTSIFFYKAAGSSACWRFFPWWTQLLWMLFMVLLWQVWRAGVLKDVSLSYLLAVWKCCCKWPCIFDTSLTQKPSIPPPHPIQIIFCFSVSVLFSVTTFWHKVANIAHSFGRLKVSLILNFCVRAVLVAGVLLWNTSYEIKSRFLSFF